MVELPVLGAPGGAAMSQSRLLYATEDGIKLSLGDMECVMMALKIPIFVKQERQAVVDLHRCKMLARACIRQPEEPRELPRRRLLVTGRNNGVIERNCHGLLLCVPAGQRPTGTCSLHSAAVRTAGRQPTLRHPYSARRTPIDVDAALSPLCSLRMAM